MLSLTIRVCIRLFRLPVVASEICEIPRNSQKFNLQQLKQARKIICVHKQLKSLRRHCTITGVGNVKQVSFKPGPEDCYGCLLYTSDAADE